MYLMYLLVQCQVLQANSTRISAFLNTWLFLILYASFLSNHLSTERTLSEQILIFYPNYLSLASTVIKGWVSNDGIDRQTNGIDRLRKGNRRWRRAGVSITVKPILVLQKFTFGKTPGIIPPLLTLYINSCSFQREGEILN